MDPYDLFPYRSVAFPETHPAHLASLGRLFGLNTADPEECRVLEIGCASGGNLIPMAWHLRGSRFVGIDLSRTQIQAGLALSRRLKLSNLELRRADILELGDDLGELDYILAHGVYSWVAPAVREHLLGTAGQLLAPGGLLYLSYNALPGWRMRGMLRDILLHACRNADTPAAKLDAAHAALERLTSAIDKLDALSAQYLREEIASLRGSHPSYLFFEYLAEHNDAVLFRDFVADCKRHGLRYVCDTELRTLFPSTYGNQVEQALADIEDGVELEQWLDFVTNRNFRQSLLCRADTPLEDAIDLERFATLSFYTDLRTSERPDLRCNRPASFATPGGNRVDVSHPLTKALLPRLAARYPECLPLNGQMPAAAREVADAGGSALAGQVNECLAELFSLFAHRVLGARPRPLRLEEANLEKPRASALALAQVASGASRIATLHHGNLDLDAFAARLLGYLDGTRSPEEAAERLAMDLTAGDLKPPSGVAPNQWGRDRLVLRTRAAVSDLVALFARYGVLEVEVRSG